LKNNIKARHGGHTYNPSYSGGAGRIMVGDCHKTLSEKQTKSKTGAALV
jgi:hypothetical protein